MNTVPGHTDGPIAPGPLTQALDRLRSRGTVTLPGCRAVPVERWLRLRRRIIGGYLGVLIAGVLLTALGLVLRDVGLWSLAIPAGVFLATSGGLMVGLIGKTTRMMGGRLRAEKEPVTLDARGITLRGIGPIPWSDVEAPERRRIRVKNEFGGRCAVMPLTPQGLARVNAQQGWWTHRVGPRPYLTWSVPYLLLPGIQGLSEDDTIELFRVAREMFAH